MDTLDYASPIHEGECYVPLSIEQRARARSIWIAATRRHRRRRALCLMIGHRWSFRMVTDAVWPQHHGHVIRVCDRCRKTKVTDEPLRRARARR